MLIVILANEPINLIKLSLNDSCAAVQEDQENEVKLDLELSIDELLWRDVMRFWSRVPQIMSTEIKSGDTATASTAQIHPVGIKPNSQEAGRAPEAKGESKAPVSEDVPSNQMSAEVMAKLEALDARISLLMQMIPGSDDTASTNTLPPIRDAPG